MIRKMLAMLVAISCAFGAWADTHISGTDFTGLTAGPFVTNLDDDGTDDGTSYWYNGDTSDFEGTIVTDGLANYLDFESNITNPLYRTISSCYDATSPSQFTTTPIGDGLFIDTHVQFTPYLVNENHPAPTGSGEDKLIVWVRETEVDGDANLTNLIITAGYVTADPAVVASNYVANLTQVQASALCSGQHRLTIKSYKNITANGDAYMMGFVVYIDETVVEYAGDAFATGSAFLPLLPGPAQYYSQGGGHNKLLPSLLPYAPSSGSIDDYAKLSAVGYAGMGKIGDVIFDSYATTYPPFAGDDRYFTVAYGDDVASYMYNDVTYYATNTLTAPATATSVTISNVTYASGYKHKDDLWRNEHDTVVSNRVDASGKDYGTFYFADGEVFTLVGFQANFLVVVGNVTNEYQSLSEALTMALAGGTLMLNNDIVITEGDGYIALNSGTLTIDLNGHTLQGTHTTWATIENLGGTLTITDTSSSHTGKLLDSPGLYCLAVYDGTSTTLDAGTYENIYIDDYEAAFTLALNGGSYYDAQYPTAQEFYLKDYATTTYVMDEVETGVWYAILDGSGPVVIPCTVTFTTNHVDATSVIVNSGDELGAENIPAFTGGSWDAPAPTAGSIITSDTNFNYTIQLSYFPQKTIEEQWADRDGTAAKPFVVRNLADLYGLQADISKGYNIDACFEQVADIDMDGEPAWAGIGAFEVTSAGAGAFEGTYDGGNHVISNVTFDQHEYHGLFASAVGAVIKNLTVDVDGFAATSSFGGAAIAGVAENCYLTNLVATGTIIGQSNTPCTHSAAGIAVRMEGTVAYACTNRCEIWSGKGKLGGIAAIGQPYNSVTGRDYLTLCSNEGDLHNTKGTLSSTEGVGGLFGYLGYHGTTSQKQHVTITDCRSIGTVYSVASNNSGSFVGNTSDLNVEAIVLSGTNVTLDGMPVVYNSNAGGSVTYGKSIGNGLVELCTQAAFETNNTYSTLYSGLTPTFEFSAPGTISFNTNLFQATAFAITATGIDVTESESGGIVTFTAGSSDPWAPTEQTDAAASNKVVSIFGEGSDVANHVTTLAQYEALVTYIKSVTSQSEVPTDLTTDQKTWMWKSFILGANPLFDEEPAVQITSLTAGATAGLWDFTVKVTEGDDTDAYNVAADKVGALVKISSSLTSGTWVAPSAGNIEAVKLLGGNLIQVEVNFGDGTSGFMKVSE